MTEACHCRASGSVRFTPSKIRAARSGDATDHKIPAWNGFGQDCHSLAVQPGGLSIHEHSSGAVSIVTGQMFSRVAFLTCWLALISTPHALAMPSPFETDDATRVSGATSGLTRLAQAQPAQAPHDTGRCRPRLPPPTNRSAMSRRSPAARPSPATTPRRRCMLQDDIFQGDVLQTSANSTLGVTFNDATTFNLTASATITVDNYVYEDGGKQNGALFDVARGTVAFVAAAVAHTGDMKISTPIGDARHSRHHRPDRGAARRVRRQPQQCRDQALSRRRRPGRTHRGQRPRRRAARFPHAGLERLYHPARRRGTLRRGAAG